MANPFDEFDTPTANPFDEFDSSDPVNKIPGLEHSLDSSRNVGKDDSTVLDKARGLVEAAAGAVTGIPATIAEGAGQLFFGTEPGKVSSQFFQPRTEKGKEYTEAIGEFANRNLNPLLGGIGHAQIPKVLKKGEDIVVNKVKEKQAEIDAANKPTSNPFDEFDSKPGEGAFQEMHDQLRAGESSPVDFTEPRSPMPDMADQLSRAGEEQRGAVADEVIAARQKALEDEVAQKGTADYNAAERTRQEKAAIPPPEDPASMTPNVDPETAQWHQLLLDEVGKDEPKSGTPAFFKDPNAAFPSPLRVKKGQRGAVLMDVLKKTDDGIEPIRTREPTKAELDLRAALREDAKSHVGKLSQPVWVPPRQRGAVNPEVFMEGFQKLKQLADGTWLRAFNDGHSFTIEAIKEGHEIGHVTFDAKYIPGSNERMLEAFSTRVHPDSRGKGVATNMYQFASELGNDIQPSAAQTAEGRAMWEGFKAKGTAADGVIRSPGNKQMGALRIGERKRQQLDKLIPERKNMIPEDPDVPQAIQEAYGEKDNKQFNYTESGGTLAAMKRGSTMVLAASRLIQNAVKRADLAIRENVFPVEKAFRGLSRGELQTVAQVMKEEMFSGKRYDPKAIEMLSLRQQEAYAHMRKMFDDTLRVQNEARAAKGQKPITEMEAYLSSRWDGDFRRPVFQAILNKDGSPKLDAEGNIEKKLVWYLAADTKQGLERQWKALQKEHPDLTFDPKEDHVVRYYKRQTDLQSAYSTMLDILGRDDPAVAKLQEALQHQTVNEGASFLGQEKHFKEKAGIRGFVGDRPGKGRTSEALAMFQQQIIYAKNAYKWSELQKAADGIKQLVSDPRLVDEQPNNVKYVKEYFKNAIGYGEDRAIAHLEDSIRNLGISPSIIDHGLGGMKSFFILQKLGVSAGYSLANVVQTTMVLPHLVDQFAKGYHGNPLTAIGVGIPGGIAMATGHYANFLGLTEKGKAITPESNFLMKAFKYAEDNGVTSRSIYDESPINSSFSITGRVGKALGVTMTAPEILVRSMSYMTFVEFLRSSGKFRGNDTALFQKAEELVNASMVDYRAQERPLMYAKLGIAGNFLNTLQTYPMNWYNQFNYMGRQAAKGNVAPLVAMLAVQYAVAGAMGVPGFDDITKLYGFIKDHLPVDLYLKAQESDFFSNPKLWMVKNLGQASVYGVLSDKSGIGLTSRVAAPGLGEMIQSPGGPIADIAKQGVNIAQAAVDPTNKAKLAQVAMASAPSGLQGLVETAPGMEGLTFEKRGENTIAQRPGAIEDHKGVYERTPQETTLRKFGLRSQKETVEREIGYQNDHDTKVANEKARSIPDAFYDAVKQGNKARASQLYTAYAKLTGNGISDTQLENQIKENYMTSIERSSTAARSVMALQNIARMQALLAAIRKENAK